MPRCLPSAPSAFITPDHGKAQKDGNKSLRVSSGETEGPSFQVLLKQLSNEHERALHVLRNENSQLHSENRRLQDSLGVSSQFGPDESRKVLPPEIVIHAAPEGEAPTLINPSREGTNTDAATESRNLEEDGLSELRGEQTPAAKLTKSILSRPSGLPVKTLSQKSSMESTTSVPLDFAEGIEGSKSLALSTKSMNEEKVLLCPNGHPFEKCGLQTQWQCGRCYTEFDTDGENEVVRYRCDLCLFDLCGSCWHEDTQREQHSIVRCSISSQEYQRASHFSLEDTIEEANTQEEAATDDEADKPDRQEVMRILTNSMTFVVDDLWKERPTGFVVSKSTNPAYSTEDANASTSSAQFFPKSLLHLPQHGSSLSLMTTKSWKEMLRERFRFFRFRQPMEGSEASCCDLLEFFISYPSSMHRVAWDITGTLLIVYDVVVLPLKLFELEETAFINTMDWLTLLFWTADIVASFLVGYIDKGITVMDPKKIARHYLRTWFFIDSIIVFLDWGFKVVKETDSGVGIGRILRFLRIARTVRLIRLFKLKRMYIAIQDHIQSDVAVIAVDIAKLILSVLMLAHFISCLWYHLGANPPSGAGDIGWIGPWKGDSKTHLYTISLEWALTKLLLESIDVHPVNIEERTCSICVAIFGMIVFTSVVSKLTSSMVSLQSMRGDTSRQFWLLRRYFKERSVPKELATRIQRYLEHACQEQEHHVQEMNIPILQLLSAQLSDELQYQFHNQELSIHPLFCHISWTSDITMHRLSKLALSRIRMARNDSLMHAGEVSESMYIVVSGSLSYKNLRLHWVSSAETNVQKGDWICEPSLWVLWIHLGNTHATTEAEVLALNAKVFRQVMRTNLRVWQLTATYAAHYVGRLNGKPEFLTDVHNSTKEYWPLSKFIDNFDTNAGLRNWRHIANFSKALSRKASFHRI